MLKVQIPKFYKVKDGQTLYDIAQVFGVSAYMLARLNSVKKELVKGQILKIPMQQGNLYVVKEGDSKKLLCGSEENYENWNGTKIFYIGMQIVIGVNKL